MGFQIGRARVPKQCYNSHFVLRRPLSSDSVSPAAKIFFDGAQKLADLLKPEPSPRYPDRMIGRLHGVGFPPAYEAEVASLRHFDGHIRRHRKYSDRKSVVSGKSGSVRVDPGGRRIM